MTTDSETADEAIIAPSVLPSPTRWKIVFYLSILVLLLSFGAPLGGLIRIPITFLLKNKLHLTANEVARFKLLVAIPLYVSFVFGFIRDTWNPFRKGDRGFLMLFGGISAALYMYFAFSHIGYVTLLVALMLLNSSFLFVSSAQSGLTSEMGQQHLMSGQVSTAWNIFASLPAILALLVGGSLSDLLEEKSADEAARILFLVGAAIMMSIAVYGAWKPGSVFDNLRSERGMVTHSWKDLRRLVDHRPIYPALLIWFLWNFMPGSGTPLQYFLQNTLRAQDAQWGQWNAIFAISSIPTFILFGFLCRRFALRTLLFWGTIVAVPQMVPLLFVHSMTGAFISAAFMGLMGGLATAAYLDLIIRSCPTALQGTTLMMATSLSAVAIEFGDVLGTNLYDDYGGFGVCVIAVTIVYALIIPVVLLVPKQLIATADGEVARFGSRLTDEALGSERC
jgi:MFS family permease